MHGPSSDSSLPAHSCASSSMAANDAVNSEDQHEDHVVPPLKSFVHFVQQPPPVHGRMCSCDGVDYPKLMLAVAPDS